MDFKKLLGAGLVASLALVAGCGDDSASANKESERDSVDTLYVFSKDTILVKDTLVILDTLVYKDTIYSKDTVYRVDSTVVYDTLVGLNGESCYAEDTLSADNVAGFNFTCGTKRVGTLWDGKNGSSAYEQAVAAGYVGSEEEWQITIAKRVNQDRIVDFRDGQEYRIVKIGNQTWMAENLNYRYLAKTADFDSSSFCYNNIPENCDKYGRLYLYSAAIDSTNAVANDEYECGNGSDCDDMPDVIRGICPEGWHLPDTAEINELMAFADQDPDEENLDISGLKSVYGWIPKAIHISSQKVIKGGNGTDLYGFDAFPAGHGSLNVGATMKFEYDGLDAIFWLANPDDSDIPRVKAHMVRFTSFSASFGGYAMSDANSIRCIKDVPVVEEEEEEEDEEEEDDE